MKDFIFSFLGFVDLNGTHFEEDIVCTGYGQYIATPLLRKLVGNKKPTIQEAIQYLTRAMTVLYYRHCQTINKVQIAIMTAEKSSISKPYKLKVDWSVGKFYKGASSDG